MSALCKVYAKCYYRRRCHYTTYLAPHHCQKSPNPSSRCVRTKRNVNQCCAVDKSPPTLERTYRSSETLSNLKLPNAKKAKTFLQVVTTSFLQVLYWFANLNINMSIGWKA